MFYVWRTNPNGGRYHIAAGDALQAPAREHPLQDAGLCGRLDVRERFPDCLEWDVVSMSLPGFNPDARSVICGDCLRTWERETILTVIGGAA